MPAGNAAALLPVASRRKVYAAFGSRPRCHGAVLTNVYAASLAIQSGAGRCCFKRQAYWKRLLTEGSLKVLAVATKSKSI
jgi:hypothetical protein